MKKIIPVLLIILISLNSFGFNLLLDYLIFQCKRDYSTEKYYPSNEIVVLKIIPDENKNLQRVDDNEIRYKNKMYDIVKEVKENNVLFIYCISDKKEDGLFDLLFKINKNDNPKDQSKTLFTNYNLIKNYILNDNEISHFQHKIERTLYFPCLIYTSPVKEIILPPPEFSLITIT